MQQHYGTTLKFSTTAHPQTDGQSERVIQILEEMLRTCALDLGNQWDDNVAYAEFAYNNSYQTSIGMAPFEALYGRKCQSPLYWRKSDQDQNISGPLDMVGIQQKVQLVQERLRTAQSRQKSYADNRRRKLEFSEGERVFFKLTPRRSIRKDEKEEETATALYWTFFNHSENWKSGLSIGIIS
jgi:hypothetical protein